MNQRRRMFGKLVYWEFRYNLWLIYNLIEYIEGTWCIRHGRFGNCEFKPVQVYLPGYCSFTHVSDSGFTLLGRLKTNFFWSRTLLNGNVKGLDWLNHLWKSTILSLNAEGRAELFLWCIVNTRCFSIASPRGRFSSVIPILLRESTKNTSTVETSPQLPYLRDVSSANIPAYFHVEFLYTEQRSQSSFLPSQKPPHFSFRTLPLKKFPFLRNSGKSLRVRGASKGWPRPGR